MTDEPTGVSPPPLQPPGLHVPPLQLRPVLDLPATLRIQPWITDAATDYLETFMAWKRGNSEPVHALECGAGSSTGYLAQRVARLVSIDHDANWHTAIRAAVSAIGCNNVEWRTLPRSYAPALGEYNENSFDIVLVDGRDRTACVEQARKILAPGGVLVVDNTERINGIDGTGPYHAMLDHTNGWPYIHFEQSWRDRAGWMPPHRWITSVWRKPGRQGGDLYTSLGLPL